MKALQHKQPYVGMPATVISRHYAHSHLINVARAAKAAAAACHRTSVAWKVPYFQLKCQQIALD